MEDNVELQIADLAKRLFAVEQRLGNVEQRLGTVEQRLGAVEQDVAVIKSNYATKVDVVEAKNSVIMWVVSAIFLAQLLPLLLKKLGM
jgi:hypothetical protein